MSARSSPRRLSGRLGDGKGVTVYYYLVYDYSQLEVFKPCFSGSTRFYTDEMNQSTTAK